MSFNIAITNQKGGVGKTTTSVNLAASLAALTQRVLLIDLDPQGNTTTGCGINKNDIALSINEVLLEETLPTDAVVTTEAKFDLLPSNGDLTVAEISLLQQEDREFCLQKILLSLKENYDYILIDCPPSLNMLTINALVAAQGVIIPMQCEYYALEGLSSLIETIEEIQQKTNPSLEIEGLVRTLFDGRNSLTNQVSDQLLQHFPGKVYETVIPRNVRLAEAPSHGMPILLYDCTSSGAIAYLALAKEILVKHGKTGPLAPQMTNHSFLTKRSESIID